MEFRVLGSLEVLDGDRSVPLGGPKQRAVLAALLVDADRVVSIDQLLEVLWGDAPPETALKTLRTYVFRLRRALERFGESGAALLTKPPGYVLQVGNEGFDARRFERGVTEGERLLAQGLAEAAAERLREALALWRGPAYADFRDEPFAQPEVVRLEELRLTAIEQRIEAELTLGYHADLIGELESLVREMPLLEHFWAQLMLALYRSGRQAEALRAYGEARQILAEELGIDPSLDLQKLEQMILVQDRSLKQVGQPAPNNLPADTSTFVGRERELREVLELLTRTRLLTMTGIGGVGKTRLARKVAEASQQRFPEGVWLIELSELDDPGRVPGLVASSLGLRLDPDPIGEGVLIEQLRSRRALLVLDGCEPVKEGCSRFADTVLRSAPSIRILATSREPLDTRGETLWPVSPLAVPDLESDDRSPEDLLHYDGVRLFIDRAGAARPGFNLTADNARSVVQICRRLEGIPLAIELAAAQIRTLSVAQIAIELHDRVRLLEDPVPGAPPRHQTLTAALDWSHEALTEAERHLFHKLSVFIWDFPLRAAEVLCADNDMEESEVLPLLSRLVDRSLVVMEERKGESRYRMLDVVGEYASRVAGWQAVRHNRAYFLALAQRTDERLRRGEWEMWSTLLDGDRATVRQTLEIAYGSHASEQGSFLAGAVAALKSETRRIGFIGGVEGSHLRPFQTGYEAGARCADPDIVIDVKYLSRYPDHSGYWNPAAMLEEATTIYRTGADVIFHAAGPKSGEGLYEAARHVSNATGRHRWAIGVDFDEYRRVDDSLKPHILTSVRLQVPLNVYEQIKSAVTRGDLSKLPKFDLQSEGVGLSFSGGFVDDIADRVNELRKQIIRGEITVPSSPGARPIASQPF